MGLSGVGGKARDSDMGLYLKICIIQGHVVPDWIYSIMSVDTL